MSTLVCNFFKLFLQPLRSRYFTGFSALIATHIF